MKLLFYSRIKSPPQPPEWLAWWMDKVYSLPALSLNPPPLCPSPWLSTSSVCQCKSSHTSSFRSSTSNVFRSSSFRMVAFSSAILFWFLRKSCARAAMSHSYWFSSKYMLGKRILKKHTPVNLRCHHQQIIFRDFYSTEYVGKYFFLNIYISGLGILQLKILSHFTKLRENNQTDDNFLWQR